MTGTGCALGGLTAACIAVSEPFIGAHAASAGMCLAAEDAVRVVRRPGSFKVALLDALANLDLDSVDKRVGLR